MIAWIDGEWMPASEARVSVLDHGVLYGDGVFEGIRFYDRKPFLLDEHLARLESSARAILLDLPYDRTTLADVCTEAAARMGLNDGYLRLVVTRGRGALGVSPHTCPRPTTFVIAAPLQLYPEECYRDGVVVVTSAIRRANPDALPPQVKSLNYLTSVLASLDARRQGAHEALVLNAHGHIAECSADNVFCVSRGVLRTPVASHGALDGITRQLVLRLARDEGIAVEEALLTPADAWAADEMFLTGTGAEIVPVRMLDGRPLPAERPITDRLRAAFRGYIASLRESQQNGVAALDAAHLRERSPVHGQ
jgi:branched-chain amino acid aminotransferase